jgi:hypothetical protein
MTLGARDAPLKLSTFVCYDFEDYFYKWKTFVQLAVALDTRMRTPLIICASFLMAALSIHLVDRLTGIRLPKDKHWEDKTWSQFITTLFGVYHPTVINHFTTKPIAIGILVGLATFVVTNIVLMKIF